MLPGIEIPPELSEDRVSGTQKGPMLSIRPGDHVTTEALSYSRLVPSGELT